MIDEIFIFPNGMVAVCDQKGNQISQLQGRYTKQKKMLLYLMKAYPQIKVRGNIYQKKQEWENEWNFWLPYIWNTFEEKSR